MIPAVVLEESMRYALQCRVPISNELTSNPVNSGPLIWTQGTLAERISYVLQCGVCISNELMYYPMNPEH